MAQNASPAGPDPREIPIPRIQAPLGTLPGVDQLPVRKEMPDVMLMNDGTKVTTRAQWEKRREEIKRTLAYYAVGQMPPRAGQRQRAGSQIGNGARWLGEISPGAPDVRPGARNSFWISAFSRR